MKTIFFCLFLLFMIVMGCSQDEDKIEECTYKNIEGTIVGPISCNKIAYEVKLDNSNNLDFESIGVINLAEELQQNGLKIKFDMVEYKDEELACVTLRPNKFCEIIHANINNSKSNLKLQSDDSVMEIVFKKYQIPIFNNQIF